MHNMQASDGVRYEQSAKTGGAARKIITFEAGLTSRGPRGARRFPLSISRTAAALPFRSALTCAQAPSRSDCTGRSGAAPPGHSVRLHVLRHHQPHLALWMEPPERAPVLWRSAPDSALRRTDGSTSTRPGHTCEGINKASAQRGGWGRQARGPHRHGRIAAVRSVTR